MGRSVSGADSAEGGFQKGEDFLYSMAQLETHSMRRIVSPYFVEFHSPTEFDSRFDAILMPRRLLHSCFNLLRS